MSLPRRVRALEATQEVMKIMRRTLIPAVVMAAIGASAVSSAQTDYPGTKYEPVNISVKAGVGIPLDSALSDVAHTFIALGGEFQLPTSLMKGSETFFNLDWFTKSFGGNPSFLNLSVNQRFYLGNDRMPGRRHYVFVGVGADFLNVFTSDTVVAARAGLGTELGENIFAEIAGYVGDKSNNNVHPDVLGVFVGYRF
jgi:hypothetical protein